MITLTLSAGLATAGAQTFGTGAVELGLTGGYASGLSGEAFVHAPNVVGPFGIKVGASYTRANNAIDTSNDLIVLDADRSGQYVIASVDGTYSLGELTPGVDATVYAGGRYGRFSATEDFGSTGTLRYDTNPFGIGAGVMVSYALAGNLSLVGDIGVDQFFNTTINSTTTGPDGSVTTDSFATNDGSYSAVSDRFIRPGTVFKARIGIKTTF